MIAMVLVGLPIAGNYLFPAPLTADIIDYDTLETGLRREATYYGAQNFVEKTTSVSRRSSSASCSPSGRRPRIRRDPLRPVAAVLVLVGYLVFRRYDLPDDVLDDDRYAEASASRSAAATYAWSSSSSSAWKGTASVRSLISSGDGQSPGPSPNRSRMYDCRWMHGR